MKAETFQKRLEKMCYTKAGYLHPKYRNLTCVLMGNKFHGCDWSKCGHRHFSMSDHRPVVREALKKLGLDFTEGNDAPRGGQAGQYIELSRKGRRQVAAWVKMQKVGATGSEVSK